MQALSKIFFIFLFKILEISQELINTTNARIIYITIIKMIIKMRYKRH